MSDDPLAETRALLGALAQFPDVGLVFTKSNADAGGEEINEAIEAFAKSSAAMPWSRSSMGALGYLSALSHCAAVAGNSSSGVVEAPSLQKPTVNIGDRQKGLRCESILAAAPPCRT